MTAAFYGYCGLAAIAMLVVSLIVWRCRHPPMPEAQEALESELRIW